MGEITDLIFTVLGKYGRWLNVTGKRVCFILWFICVIYWTARNFDLGLMVQTFSCVPNLILHVYGWWNWKKKSIGT